MRAEVILGDCLDVMRAPFPWFGGKSRAASLIWERFGDVPNYVEPFAGSLAVLLGRPHAPGTETVNDLDCFLANFWRAVQADPEAVAKWADWPVNEADLHARHRWLVGQAEFAERMKRAPDFFDAKIAGWWAWGICSWIGSGWCRLRGDGPPSQQLPHLGDAGRGEAIHRWLADLSARLSRVRVACGDWSRVMGESVTLKHGATAVLLDPPYSEEEHAIEYGAGGHGVAAETREWALANGGNPLLRIALCGYDGEHDMPPEWEAVAWKARGGYGSQGNGAGRANARRERIWFSPACIKPGHGPLFAGGAA